MKSLKSSIIRLILILPLAMALSCSKSEKPEPQTLAAPQLTVTNITDNSFTVKWEAVENATSYQIDFGGQISSKNATSVKYENLEEGKYTVKVRAISEKNFNPSDWSTAEAEIKIKWTPVEEDWYGEWTLYSDKTLVVNSDTDIRLTDGEKKVDITIEKHPDYAHQVIISGMSIQNPDLKLETIIDNGNLAFFNMVPAEMPDENGKFPLWLSFTKMKGGNALMGFMMGNFNAYTFTFTDRDHAVSTPYTGLTSEDKEFEVICFEVFTTTTELKSVGYYSEFPFECPAGNLRLERRSGQ